MALLIPLYPQQPLLNCINNRLSQLLQQHSIGLIIIDSVAAIFRLYTNFAERARDMRRMVNALLTYADKYHCAVVCTNQMAASLESESESRQTQDVPCLGLQWANLGRTRMRISKVPKQHKQHEQLLTVRKLEIIYSPETPNAFAEFLITADGIVDVPQTETHCSKRRRTNAD